MYYWSQFLRKIGRFRVKNGHEDESFDFTLRQVQGPEKWVETQLFKIAIKGAKWLKFTSHYGPIRTQDDMPLHHGVC
jgi:hypothetical protein